MAKKVGTLIKEARTNAGMTQEQLARKVRNCSASDISKAERGLKDLTQEQLKQIAKATGVTQSSLINAAKADSAGTSSGKTSSSSNKKTGSGSTAKKDEYTLTAAEKKLIDLYRAADKDTKANAVKVLKGEKIEDNSIVSTLLGGAMDLLGNLGK